MSLPLLRFPLGGRPTYNDDFELLQNTMVGLATVLLPGLTYCVLNGCAVSPGSGPDLYNISPGYVWTGCVRYFEGVTDVALPGWITIGREERSDPRTLETGTDDDCVTEYLAAWSATAPPPSLPSIAYTELNPGLTYWQVTGALTRELGLLEMVSDLSSYDLEGRGYGPKRGWHLCNGNNGTLDYRDRFPYGADTGVLSNIGDVGGEAQSTLYEANLPSVVTFRLYGSDNTTGESGFPDLGDDHNQNTAQANGRFKDGAIKMPNASNLPFSNLPPYLRTGFRQWIGLN